MDPYLPIRKITYYFCNAVLRLGLLWNPSPNTSLTQVPDNFLYLNAKRVYFFFHIHILEILRPVCVTVSLNLLKFFLYYLQGFLLFLLPNLGLIESRAFKLRLLLWTVLLSFPQVLTKTKSKTSSAFSGSTRVTVKKTCKVPPLGTSSL